MTDPKRPGLLQRYVWTSTSSTPRNAEAVTQIVLALTSAVLVVLDVLGVIDGVRPEWLIRIAVLVLGALLTSSLRISRDREQERENTRRERASLNEGLDGLKRTDVQLLHAVDAFSERLSGLTQSASAIQLPPTDINSKLQDILSSSTSWVFRGGSGGWLRSNSLPALARVKTQDVSVRLQLLDPRDAFLLNQCAKYRSAQRGFPVEARSVLEEILACVGAAGYWSQKNPRITPEINFLRTFSPLRYDIGTTGLVASVADHAQPGLYASAGGWYYISLVDEFEQAGKVLPRLTFGKVPLAFAEDSITAEEAESLISSCSVYDDGNKTALIQDGMLPDWETVANLIVSEAQSV